MKSPPSPIRSLANRWRHLWWLTALVPLAPLSGIPPANACVCALAAAGAQPYERADLVFEGRLVEIRAKPAWLNLLLSAMGTEPEPTKLVFQVTRVIKGHASQRQEIRDATRYGTDCDHGPPDFARILGRTVRVIAYRYQSTERPSEPVAEYAVFFTFCDTGIELPGSATAR